MKVLVAAKRVIDYNVKIYVKADGSGVGLANVKIPMDTFLTQVTSLHHPVVRGAAGALALRTNSSESKLTDRRKPSSSGGRLQ